MKKIKLTRGKYAIVDDEDYSYLNRFRWRYEEYKGKIYVVRQVMLERSRITIPMIDFILDRGQAKIAIYKSSNGLDLRKENLMFSDKSHRSAYSRKWSKKTTSKYKGVDWSKQRGKWRARTTFYGKGIHLGFFRSERKAGMAYNKKAKELYGELAYQNKIK